MGGDGVDTGGMDGTAVRALLDAVIGVGEGLDLPTVLQRIVRTACEVTGARYAALGVRDGTGEVGDFYSHGVGPAERALLGETPHGRGLPGLLLADGARPLRLDDLTTHPAFGGWPQGHPSMGSFLGVPIRVGPSVFGNLYVAERTTGGVFTDQEEQGLLTLASAAGVAVGNARLYQAARRRQRWWEAASAAVHAVLDAADHGTDGAADDLGAVARVSAEAAGAELVVVLLDEFGTLQPVAAHGERAAGLVGALGDLSSDDLSTTGSTAGHGGDTWVPQGHPLHDGPGTVVPMALGGRRVGALALAWRRGHGPDEEDLVLLRTYAERVALAVEASRASADRAALALLQDRDRIARDLHDLVIQRLFAVGLSLQAAGNVARVPEVATRLARAVDDLDDTIKDVRRTIFRLHGTAVRSPLRDELEQLAATARSDLGIPVRLVVDGPILAVPDDVAPDVLAVVREALANVAKHAEAGRAEVHLRIGRTLDLEITDDGVGLVPGGRRSGLANLAERAAAHGGTLRIESGPDDGTRLLWSVPRH